MIPEEKAKYSGDPDDRKALMARWRRRWRARARLHLLRVWRATGAGGGGGVSSLSPSLTDLSLTAPTAVPSLAQAHKLELEKLRKKLELQREEYLKERRARKKATGAASVKGRVMAEVAEAGLAQAQAGLKEAKAMAAAAERKAEAAPEAPAAKEGDDKDKAAASAAAQGAQRLWISLASLARFSASCPQALSQSPSVRARRGSHRGGGGGGVRLRGGRPL